MENLNAAGLKRNRGFGKIQAKLLNRDQAQLIKEALEHVNEIAEKVNEDKFEIYFGTIPEKNFAYDYHYGKYENGKVTKIENDIER